MTKVNSAVITGMLVRNFDEYGVIKTMRIGDHENQITVWGLPRDVHIGDMVTLDGSLMCGQVKESGQKRVLGVRVNEVLDVFGSQKVSFTAKIHAKSAVRYTAFGKRIVDLTFKVDENTYVPAIAWHDLAEIISEDYEVGETVEVIGFLSSREYGKYFRHDNVVAKITTEFSIAYITKI